MNSKRGTTSPPTAAQIVARVLAGDSGPEIATFAGMSYGRVAAVVHEETGTGLKELRAANGIKPRRKFRPSTGVDPELSDEQIVAHVLDGQPLVDIAARYGVHVAVVQYRIKRATGRSATQLRRDAGLLAGPDQDHVIVARVLAGEPTRDIAADAGLSVAGLIARVRRRTGMTPTQLLKAKGLQTPPSANTYPDVSDEEIVARVLDGESRAAIAARYGFSEATVAQRVLRHTGMTAVQLRHEARSATGSDQAAHGEEQQSKPGDVFTSPSQRRLDRRKGTMSDDDIVAALLAGETGKAIAERCGVSDATLISRVRRYTGMKPTELRRANGWGAQVVPPVVSQEIVDAYRSDPRLTVKAAAIKFGVSGAAIRTVLTTYEVPFDPTRRSVPSIPDDGEEIADLYLAGMTTVEIADWFSINESSVRRALDFRQVKRRPIHESKEIHRRRTSLDS